MNSSVARNSKKGVAATFLGLSVMFQSFRPNLSYGTSRVSQVFTAALAFPHLHTRTARYCQQYWKLS
ncbi:hypothetical protein J6590_019888 [Homalodisca vitripennis]|nr:hypothetical protein J6590_019888 [Homalodisca vitripennis]